MFSIISTITLVFIFILLVKGTISSLISAGKIVYISVGYIEIEAWENIFDSQDEFECNKNITSLIEFINTTKINGIVLQMFNLFVSKILNYLYKF